MNTFQQAPIQELPKDILEKSSILNPQDDAYINHPIIQHFGSPLQPIYVDQCHVDINGVSYDNPLILPIYDGQLELVQCAVLQDGQRVQVIPENLSKGFAVLGELHQNKPVIITYSLEAFFKIAQTGYAVALVLLPILFNARQAALKAFDFEQTQFVIHQLSKSGFDRLYLPVRPEQIQLEAFKSLEKNSPVRLLNQFQKAGESEFLTELLQDDDAEEVKAFLDYAIEQLPPLNQWGALLPLVQPETSVNSIYPIHALPPLARDAVIAIAEHVQAPIAMTAQCVIGAMSHIAQAHVNAPHPFNPQGEPCSLYLLTEGQSGSRKSTSRNMADKAIIQHERKQYELYRRDLE
ncbi:YfjI family protein, partial [Acinetobacter johnsonii]|uniref:DUF3987 domain-containing protein n=1 Tax=Acinetobacter johnsonii TaxID=40214 RepID=UPI00244BC194